jgi:dihydrofolate synthase/folylpolyglutamate synthase
MDFEQALAYLQSLRRFGIKLGNERIEALLERIGNPHRGLRCAHIAGTKGKGSTTAMVAAILQAHGFHVGAYYSPYVYDVRERVQVDGEMIGRRAFAALVTRLEPHIAALAQTPYGSTTEFELKTALCFRHLADEKVYFAAIEVGIGGRLDATNVITPQVSVITNIGLDHTHVLGDTHAKIAAEKAGIIKPGVPAVTATEEPSALAVIRQVAAERQAPLVHVLPSEAGAARGEAVARVTAAEDRFAVETPNASYCDLSLRLRGDYQRLNAACAIVALERMAESAGFTLRADAVSEGLRRAYLPGRLDVVHRHPLVIMDGAHNGLAADALAREVVKLSRGRLLLVVGMAAGHPPETVLEHLGPLASTVYATRPIFSRGLPEETIADAARVWCSDVRTVTPPIEAARQALASAEPEDLVLITGSFYTVGDVHPADLLGRRRAHSPR